MQDSRRSRRRISSLVLVLAALAGLVAADRALGVYECYWANSSCGFGGIAQGISIGSPVYVSATERPFMNNQNAATSKKLQRFNNGTSLNGSWIGGPRIWVVPIGPVTNQQYRCINIHNAPISVNCGHY